MDLWWRAVPDLLVGGWCILSGPEHAVVQYESNADLPPHPREPEIREIAWGLAGVDAKLIVSLHNAVLTGKILPDDDMIAEWYA